MPASQGSLWGPGISDIPNMQGGILVVFRGRDDLGGHVWVPGHSHTILLAGGVNQRHRFPLVLQIPDDSVAI